MTNDSWSFSRIFNHYIKFWQKPHFSKVKISKLSSNELKAFSMFIVNFPRALRDSAIIWSCAVMWQIKYVIFSLEWQQWIPNIYKRHVRSRDRWHYIYTTTMPMATKFGRKVIYHDRLPLIKLHDPLNAGPCKITWQIKSLVSLLSQWLRTPNLETSWLRIPLIKSNDHLNK